MSENYVSIRMSTEQAAEIAHTYYGISGEASSLPGELDFNFKISSPDNKYILKISRPDADMEFIEYQESILNFLKDKDSITPEFIRNKDGNSITEILDENGQSRIVRLLSWLDGRLWSEVNPHSKNLLVSLGQKAGQLTKNLQEFDHEYARRDFEWDIAKVGWTKDYLHLFEEEDRGLVSLFLDKFELHHDHYEHLPKSVVHNDVNDNNIVVSSGLANPEVIAAIDFGDAVYTQAINDLAITIAYAAMNKPDPLEAACQVIRGYAEHYLPTDAELQTLYVLIAARLIISVSKSAINKEKEPDNEYLLISDLPAWDLLRKWRRINENYAYFCFRNAAGLPPVPNQEKFEKVISGFSVSIADLIPVEKTSTVIAPDLGVGSRWVGTLEEQENINLLTQKFKHLQQANPEAVIAGGYGETRSIYSTEAYRTETNNGPEYRTVHLGVDFWFPAGTEIKAILDGKVHSLVYDDKPKDYGVCLILEHNIDDFTFYSLYGHLGKDTLNLFDPGDKVSKGDIIAYLGDFEENGGWSPHLHFQLMHDMLGNEADFPGVATYRDKEIWLSLCPDPAQLFNEVIPGPVKSEDELLNFRKEHLGKSLSLSYNEPLTILRGHGPWLIDNTGRKYLDTVNNVAHVGHEHPDVVRTGQEQMAVLNTNTRYLNRNINEFAEELLKTLPPELSVVHVVNSGSEANELALRMAKTYTGEQDMIAMEVGYHGNTNACIEVSSYKFDSPGGQGCPPQTHIVPLPDRYRGIYQGDRTGPKYASHVREEIQKVKKEGRGIAGFICESIISCGGQIELPEQFLSQAYDYVREAGGVCISDEVQVGCGRVGSAFWGFQLHDVVPDIVTIGKPIGNGHPLAAVVCKREIADAFANGLEFFNTFGGNPVSSVIGKTVLEVVKREKLQQNAHKTGNYLKAALTDLQLRFPVIGDVRGQGLFLGFELCNSEKEPLPEKAGYLTNRMKELGVLMSIDGPDHNVLKIKPPMVFSKANADELISNLEKVFAEDFMHL